MSVDKVNTLINEHWNRVLCQLLMTQLCAIRISFFTNDKIPIFRLTLRHHDEVARVGWTIDENC